MSQSPCYFPLHWALFGIIFLIGTGAQTLESADYYDEAGQIFTTIFHKYNERISPVKKYPNPVMVNLELSLVHIREVDQKRNELDAVIDLRVNWLDARLFWYAYNIKHITVNISTIWSPDVPLMNVISTPEAVISPRYLVVNSTGDVFWYRRLHTRTTCEPETENTNVCAFKFGSRQMTTNQQDFGSDITCGISEDYVDPMFDVQEMGVERHIRSLYHSPMSGSYSEVHCIFNVTSIGEGISGASSTYSLHIGTVSTLLIVLGIHTIHI